MLIRVRLLVLILGLAVGVGCLDPAVVQERARVFEAGLLDSIQDGRSTRQDILLRLGTPSGTFEGGRILTYDFVMEASGEWRRMGTSAASGWSYAWPRTASLVLVFGPEERLVRHRLVWDLPTAGVPPKEAPSAPSQARVP